MKQKLTSRKFWLAVAAFLGSIGASIAGLSLNSPELITVGTVCSITSAAVYQALEASIDLKRAYEDKPEYKE